MARRVGRRKNQLPDSYYEGYLERRLFKDKTSRRLWTCLCGNTLFFYNDMRDSDYVEKLELSEFISVTNDSSPDRNLDAARFNLQMKNENIKFTAVNAEAREMWKAYIQSVAELTLPTSLNLLPGQIHVLTEVVQSEKDRISKAAPYSTPSSNSTTDSSLYIMPDADLPACYHNVSRMEAELLLEKEAKKGNLLLRPGRDKISFAVSTRQDFDVAVFRHYRVSQNYEGGFVIDVENPVHCTSLHDVITFLIEKTDGNLIPLILEGPYEKTISFLSSDHENGEVTQQALPKPSAPSVPLKPVLLKNLIPKLKPTPNTEESSLNEKSMKEKKMEDSATAPPLPPKNTKTALMPPTLAACSTSCSSTSASFTSDSRKSENIEKQIPQAAISELQLKFQQRMKNQE